MLYTRKGDGGTTKLFACDQRISKSSATAEALGSLDEINSLLGFVKSKCRQEGPSLKTQDQGRSLPDILHAVQQNLFIIQAELAGAPKAIVESKVKEVEKIVDDIEKEVPPIKSFFVPGGDELSALFDYARTVARRAERRVVAVVEQNSSGDPPVGGFSLAYLNRLSSLLSALARLMNHKSGIKEVSPDYR